MESEVFQHIAIAVRPKLTKLCRSFFDRQEMAFDAEDAVQETLLRLCQMKDRLNDYRSPEALAVMIAKNVCIDILKTGKEQHDSLNENLCLIGNYQTDDTAIAHDTERQIEKALEKLPKTQRKMLLMRSEGMSMMEIAATCGTTATSTKTLICAARRRMMELLMIRRNKQ